MALQIHGDVAMMLAELERLARSGEDRDAHANAVTLEMARLARIGMATQGPGGLFLSCQSCIGAECKVCDGEGRLSREGFRRHVGGILDHPSVYMGGASQQSRRRAESVAEFLESCGVNFSPST